MAITSLCKTYVLLLAVASAFVAQIRGIDSCAQAAEGDGVRHAIIVAVTKYPSLPESLHLSGPANDAQLMRKLLIEKFNFQAENIVSLTESSDSNHLPTKRNIISEFERLATDSKANDQVVIFLAGHGSQQPDDDPNNPEDLEPDGLDEVFLPRDIGSWESEVTAVENAITDDEIRHHLAKIQDSGAFIWLIVDSCHSGTMMRGSSDEVVRQVPASLLIPDEALTRAGTEASNDLQISRSPSPASGPKLDMEKVVAIYAAQSTEPTIEKRLPRGGNPRKSYGLLTYTINNILASTTTPLTYRELASRVQQQYVAWGRTYPTPLIEGGAIDKEVLGLSTWPNRSQILVTVKNGSLRINHGSIHGVTPGSVIKILDPSGSDNPNEVITFARVSSVAAFDAEIAPVDFQDMAANSNIPENARAEIVYVDFGLNPLVLAADRLDAQSEPLSSEELERISSVVKEIEASESLGITVTENANDAEWLLQSRDGEIFIVPRQGVVEVAKQSSSQLMFGPVPTPEPAQWIVERLNRIQRGRSLLAMATPSEQTRGFGAGIEAEISLLRFSSTEDRLGEPVVFSDGGHVLAAGEIIGFELTNNSQYAIDVTLLFVDSQYGISPYFPRPGTLNNNRLPPGKSVRTPRARVTTASGLEHVLLISVKGEGLPIDFSCLGQPSIEQARTRGIGTPLDSPLGRLFKQAVFREGNTRGLAMDVIDTHSIQTLSWKVATHQTSD